MAPVGRVIGGLVAACACFAPAADAFFTGVALPPSRAGGETPKTADELLTLGMRSKNVFAAEEGGVTRLTSVFFLFLARVQLGGTEV